MQFRVPITDPVNFSFSECLCFLSRSPKECLHYIVDGKIRRMILTEGEPAVIEITMEPGADYLTVEVLAPEEPVATAPIAAYITRWLHLDESLNNFYQFTETDPLLKGLAQEFKGLRLIGMPDLFEALSWAIIGQQINLTFAYTLRERLIKTFGFHTNVNGMDYYLYPQPAVIAALTPEQLQPMQFSRSKAQYLINTATSMVNGELSPERLDQMDYETARESLVALKGIGNWSANYALMKYRRFPQSVLLEDVGLQNAIKNRLNLKNKPSMPELQTYTRLWKEHTAYATFYLWRSLLPQ
ncbi:DNA-3-methyladenine glycosylase 2 family protein [Chitinophaga silvatica]|uniref:DNA-3-methyladenine glycosylase II n=1 Tax=Chitinophaga silvatica TaxID=2282649 RepID=A0A3E1Y6B1_9BACT|nr:DNA-3-methyladenine glycosylase [Chitinophaga silvatica]RFS20451.1 DNA-3-methyladenine glycosylase 2 family protein [Chitinophaga silvatica]